MRRGQHKKTTVGLGLALLALTSVTVAADSWTVTDIAGQKHNLLNKKNRATVLIFVAHDCPISNAYTPEINRIYKTYTPKRVAFYIVYAEPGLTAATARKHRQEFGHQSPALLDPRHNLVKKTGVTVTPEVAVLSPAGKVLYRGRIDDRYVTWGKQRYQPTTRDLRQALESVLNRKPVVPATTKAIGCFIPAGE